MLNTMVRGEVSKRIAQGPIPEYISIVLRLFTTSTMRQFTEAHPISPERVPDEDKAQN